MTKYIDFLNRVIDDGIAAVKIDYAEKPEHLEGAIAGFEACRNKNPIQLHSLLEEVRLDTRQALSEEVGSKRMMRYWYWRCRELEVGWVCNVLSAVLLNEGHPVIVNPTARGMMKAAEIVGVRGE